MNTATMHAMVTGGNTDGKAILNVPQLEALLATLRSEMGIRNMKALSSRGDIRELYFQIGFAHSTCWVEMWVGADDLYYASIFKLRHAERKVLASLEAIDAGNIRRALLDTWCTLCSERGW